jgi:hypothetical protein
VPEFSLQISEESKNLLRKHFEKFPVASDELRAASEDAGASAVQSLLPGDMQGAADGVCRALLATMFCRHYLHQ